MSLVRATQIQIKNNDQTIIKKRIKKKLLTCGSAHDKDDSTPSVFPARTIMFHVSQRS